MSMQIKSNSSSILTPASVSYDFILTTTPPPPPPPPPTSTPKSTSIKRSKTLPTAISLLARLRSFSSPSHKRKQKLQQHLIQGDSEEFMSDSDTEARCGSSHSYSDPDSQLHSLGEEKNQSITMARDITDADTDANADTNTRKANPSRITTFARGLVGSHHLPTPIPVDRSPLAIGQTFAELSEQRQNEQEEQELVQRSLQRQGSTESKFQHDLETDHTKESAINGKNLMGDHSEHTSEEYEEPLRSGSAFRYRGTSLPPPAPAPLIPPGRHTNEISWPISPASSTNPNSAIYTVRTPEVRARHPHLLSKIPTPPRMQRGYSEGQDAALSQQGQKSRYGGGGEKSIVAGASASSSDEIVLRSQTRGSAGGILYRDSLLKANADYVIAVVGPRGVGKTTIIQKAFKPWSLTGAEVLSKDSQGYPTASSFRASVETGQPPRLRAVEIIELDIDLLLGEASEDAQETQNPAWPWHLPHIDGAMICYSALDVSTVAGLSLVLGTLCTSIPAMLIACKSDPDVTLAIPPLQGNEIGAPYEVGLVELSIHIAAGKHKMRMAFSWLLKSISKERRYMYKKSHQSPIRSTRGESIPLQMPSSPVAEPGNTIPMRPRISTQLESLSLDSSSTQPFSPHTGSSSSSSLYHDGSGTNRLLLHFSTSQNDESTIHQQDLQIPVDPEAVAFGDTANHMPGDLVDMRQAVKRTNQPNQQSTSSRELDDTGIPSPTLQPPVETPHKTVVVGTGVTLDFLLNNLLNKIISGTDSAFVNNFFLIYRMFSEPSIVLDTLVAQWRIIKEDDSLQKQHQLWLMMRISTAISQWLKVYPGDFAKPSMQATIYALLEDATSMLPFAHILEDISIGITKSEGVEDPDFSWTKAKAKALQIRKRSISGVLTVPVGHFDTDPPSPSTHSDVDKTTPEALSSNLLLLSSSKISSTDDITWNRTDTLQTPRNGTHAQLDPNHANETPSLNGAGNFGTNSEASRSKRECLEGPGSLSEFALADARMYELSDAAISIELTRLEWQMFESIRLRDCLRQVIGGERPESIAASVHHFNDISAWVSTMVLLHSKPRRRAKMFERFTGILHHLYRLKNYATFWSVLSGLRDSSIHRLLGTIHHVSPVHLKEIEDRSRVIDPTGSYGNYRQLLKENRALGSPAIPFIGVVTNDLTKIVAANKNDKDDIEDINWAKYSIMGDAIGPLALYQARGNPVAHLPTSMAARVLITDTPRLSEEALYQRSQQIEPNPAHKAMGGSSGGRRFKRMISEAVRMQEPVQTIFVTHTK